MPVIVDYFVTMISPWTFVGHRRFAEMAAVAGAEIRMKPLHIGKLFEATGGTPAAKRSPQRKAYRFQEMARWKRRFGLDDWNIDPPHFPVSDITANRMVIAQGQRGGDTLVLAEAFMRGVWVEDRDISDEPTLQEIADAAGFNGTALLQASSRDAVKADLRANTSEAIERGVFGCPSYVIGDEVFWGQDRLEFVQQALEESS